ncbi:hypothetical protein O181_033810 [Austropuccinia psidii MF-1]|uniref:Uncharacterized protein n=1 Tax=Austropuccinia psidii MF-1 TaxID=1389203 RepID=A0A9Q3H9K7_9BASI|nr:hypothetical protein [Austropuccinia psidii MF-1]
MIPSILRLNHLDAQATTTFQGGIGRKVGAPNTSHLNKAVRKDPAVLPLALIIGGVVCAAGYFAFNKAPKEGGGAESYGARRQTS